MPNFLKRLLAAYHRDRCKRGKHRWTKEMKDGPRTRRAYCKHCNQGYIRLVDRTRPF